MLVLLRLAYLTVTNAFAALRLLPMSDRDKDAEILALRHQSMALERQLGAGRVQFTSEDRAFLAALLAPLSREVLRRMRLLVQPDTVLRWHRDLMKQRHARTCLPKRPGRPPTVRSIRVLVLRLVRENPSWGYRRVHGELTTLGIKVAASTVWEILQTEGINPAPDRAATTWADFLRSQADALLACDFIETVTLTGQRQYILAVIEHATRRVRILGTTAHPTANWVAQAARNLVMDIAEAKATVTYLLRDRDAKYPALFDQILGDAGIHVALTGVRMPRMKAIMERWVQTCRHELLDRTLIWNERHLQHALRQFELHHNAQQQELASRFFDALCDGDLAGLRELLAADVSMVGDGGGKAPQLARAVIGAENVARLLASVFPRMAQVGVTFEPHEVNGQPGAIFRDRDGKALHTLALDVLGGQIQTIRAVINPGKLGHLGPVADALAIDREVKQARRQPN